jgi:hypothetical protein
MSEMATSKPRNLGTNHCVQDARRVCWTIVLVGFQFLQTKNVEDSIASDFAENRVAFLQPVGLIERNKELTAVLVWFRACHRHDATMRESQARVKLIFEWMTIDGFTAYKKSSSQRQTNWAKSVSMPVPVPVGSPVCAS